MTQFSDHEGATEGAAAVGISDRGGDASGNRAAFDKSNEAGINPRAAQASGPALAPSRQRQFLVTLIGVYPIITLLLYLVLPMTRGWPIWQTTLIVAPLMVAIMVFWMMPTIQKRFGRFIMVRARS